MSAEVTVKQLKEKIKELDEKLESTAQVWLHLLDFICLCVLSAPLL